MTQADFGQSLGVDQSAISRIEDGRRVLTARELASASTALGVTIDQLLAQETGAPALLRATELDDQEIQESLQIFNACIDEYRGVEVLAG